MAHILVINPNSSVVMTETIDHSIAFLRRTSGHRISCHTNETGPAGIETDADVAAVVPAVLGKIRAQAADAYVIACFSDPGAEPARQVTDRPVIGIAEAAYMTAMTLGRRFGVISIVESSIGRHRQRLDFLRLTGRLAGDRSIDVATADLADPRVMGRLQTIGRLLRDQDSADVVILGCAGLGHYRSDLEQSLGLPVVDPVQAGVALTAARLLLSPPQG